MAYYPPQTPQYPPGVAPPASSVAPAAGAPVRPPTSGAPVYGGMSYDQFLKKKGGKSTPQTQQEFAAHQQRWLAERGGGPTGASMASGKTAASRYNAIEAGTAPGYSQGSSDPSGMRAYSKANRMSEDYERFDDATLLSWAPQKGKGGCGGSTPYMAYDNSGCVEKPIDTAGPGGGAGGAGGGAGGRGGAGAGMPGAGATGSATMAGASDTIWQAILGRLQGGTRFTPEIMDTLMSNVKSGAERAAAREAETAEGGFTRRGLSRSTIAGSAQRDIRTGLAGDVLQSQAELARAKVEADYQDKTQAISDGMSWLNSLRSYVASMNATAAQKEAAMANIQLGYKTLQHQTNMMRETYAQDLQRLGL